MKKWASHTAENVNRKEQRIKIPCVNISAKLSLVKDGKKKPSWNNKQNKKSKFHAFCLV